MNFYFVLSLVLGVLSGFFGPSYLSDIAEVTSSLFLQFLKLLSLPLIFFSLSSTLSGMTNLREMKVLGRRILLYTLTTTLIAAFVALFLFLGLQPALHMSLPENFTVATQESYLSFLLKVIPDNPFRAFTENNVIGIAFMALLIGIFTHQLPNKEKETLHTFFKSFFSLLLHIAGVIPRIMPLGIWAFVTLLVRDIIQAEINLSSLSFYALAVVGANLIQGLVVLPLFLLLKGINPLRLFNGMSPALTTAFFTKSSSAALPVALDAAENRVGISKRIAEVTFPLCSIINMNACASFILITVLFVGASYGLTFTPFDLALWVVLASLAAIGNAGVPMGCYFLTSAFLISMHLPLEIMGFILPLYALFDMLETAVNVWSDSCIAALVDQDLNLVERIA